MRVWIEWPIWIVMKGWDRSCGWVVFGARLARSEIGSSGWRSCGRSALFIFGISGKIFTDCLAPRLSRLSHQNSESWLFHDMTVRENTVGLGFGLEYRLERRPAHHLLCSLPY